MTTTDPTTILREAIKAVVIESEADDLLATRIPQACQTCNEHGMRYTGRPETGPWETCPDCPTIGTLLLWGWNVATLHLPLWRGRGDEAALHQATLEGDTP